MTQAAAPAVLVVDDDDQARHLLETSLRTGGYAPTSVSDAASARDRLSAVEHPFALVLCDLGLPGEHGIDLVAHIVEHYPDTAVLVISGNQDPTVAARASAAGAYGYLVKPFGLDQLFMSVAGTLRRHELERERNRHAAALELAVRERTRELERARQQTVRTLALAAEFRDASTQQHGERVGSYAALIAGRLGYSLEECRLIESAALLHDVGKIGIPDRILRKRGTLTRLERRTMQTHTEIGHRLLHGSGDDLLELAATIALTHHERLDGSGYPRGLHGASIPTEGRIAAVADVLDALTSPRPYRDAFTLADAAAILRAATPDELDRDMVEALLGMVGDAPLAVANGSR